MSNGQTLSIANDELIWVFKLLSNMHIGHIICQVMYDITVKIPPFISWTFKIYNISVWHNECFWWTCRDRGVKHRWMRGINGVKSPIMIFKYKLVTRKQPKISHIYCLRSYHFTSTKMFRWRKMCIIISIPASISSVTLLITYLINRNCFIVFNRVCSLRSSGRKHVFHMWWSIGLDSLSFAKYTQDTTSSNFIKITTTSKKTFRMKSKGYDVSNVITSASKLTILSMKMNFF